MYNSIYPVKINYRKPQQNLIVKPKEEEQSSSSSYSKEAQEQDTDTFRKVQTTGRTTFPNGTNSSINYNQNKVNISQIVTDFRNTTAAIGTPDDISSQVGTYLEIIESQSSKDNPNVKLIKSNLKAASQVLDEYISESLNKPSKVVENWVDALFLQNVDYKADANAINPDYKVNIPDNKQPQPAQTQTQQAAMNVSAEIVPEEEGLQPAPQEAPATGQAKKSFSRAKKYAKADNSTKALEAFENALSIAKAEGDKQTEALIYYETGNIHAKNNDFAGALENFNNAAATTSDENIKARAHISMADIYSKADYFQPAVEHYYDAISHAGESENLTLQTKALLDVGNMYAQRYDKDNSFEYLDLAKGIAKETQDEKVIAKTYQKTADACEKLNENHLALDNLKYSTFHYTQANSPLQIAKNYESAADLMSKLGNSTKAKSLLTKAYKQYQSCGNQEDAMAVFSKMQNV